MTRVAVVTGGTPGIGAAVSKALKAAGYQVAATYHSNDEAAEKFKAETGVHVYKWNAVIYDDCVAGLSRVEKDLGPVDVLVNNAGISRDGMFHKMTPDQWYSVIHTNLNSLFNMCRPVIEGMLERGFGRIINISSLNGQKGQMGQTNYSASKAGDIGFTKALALENASNRQRHLSGLYRHRNGQGCGERGPRHSDSPSDSSAKAWRARGGRALRRVPRVRRRRVYHRLDPFGGRRWNDDLSRRQNKR